MVCQSHSHVRVSNAAVCDGRAGLALTPRDKAGARLEVLTNISANSRFSGYQSHGCVYRPNLRPTVLFLTTFGLLELANRGVESVSTGGPIVSPRPDDTKALMYFLQTLTVLVGYTNIQTV